MFYLRQASGRFGIIKEIFYTYPREMRWTPLSRQRTRPVRKDKRRRCLFRSLMVSGACTGLTEGILPRRENSISIVRLDDSERQPSRRYSKWCGLWYVPDTKVV